MAICPECFSKKPFWAPRCSECNEETGLLMQLWMWFVFYGGQILIYWLLYKFILYIANKSN